MNNATIKKIVFSVMLGFLLVTHTVSAKTVITPIRLSIPTIGVNALINPMGLTKNGAMEAPLDAKSVGWFALGPNPGDVGNAIIDGHYGIWKNGNISVFNDLNSLKPGDELYVKNNQGATVIFVVRKLLTYDRNADATDIFTSRDGASHLNIIACAGVYSKALKTYSNRLVVFADKK